MSFFMKKAIFFAILFFIFLFFAGRFKAIAVVPIGNYLELAGGYLKTETDLISSPEAFSLEVWIRPNSVFGIQHIVSIGNEDSRSLHYEVGINGGSLSFNYRYDKGSQKVITAGSLTANVWNHVAVVVSSSYTKLFINGSQIFSTSGAGQLLPIGKSIIAGGSFLEPFWGEGIFKGEIDELRISHIPRDVSSLWSSGAYQSALAADEATVVLWHLDETRGEGKAKDSSESKFHADLIGGDSKIHFYGILPTPTSYALPTLRWEKPVLPTISYPNRISRPTVSPSPSARDPTIFPLPTSTSLPRLSRPVYPR